MNLFEVLLEGRREDFVVKYKNKFNNEELKKIVMTSTEIDKTNKFLDFLGKILTSGSLENELPKAKTLIEKFKKFQENLQVKDINQIENFDALNGLITNYEDRNRRSVKKLEGADEVYSDDRVSIVTPLNHAASCYYGAGTKWCTTTMNSDTLFNKYNSNGKLFYIINKKIPSDNRLYKVALHNHYDGTQTLYDATDEVIRGGWPGGPEQWSVYNAVIQKYLNDNYSEQIEIFKDKVRAQQELQRIEIENQRRENQRRLQMMERRRAENAWGPEVEDMEAKEARAVFETVKDYFELQDGEDIYYLVPTDYTHYGLNLYDWLGEDGQGTSFAVGTDSEAQRAAVMAMREFIDDNGVQNTLSPEFYERFIDEDRLYDIYIGDIVDDIYENPESYLDDSDKQLSEEQVKEVEDLYSKIEKLRERQSKFSEEDQTWKNLQRSIEEFESMIERIDENPEGDEYREDKIEEAVERKEEEMRGNMLEYLKDMYGMEDFTEFIDLDEVAEAVVDADGRGTTLNHYDGVENESRQGNTWYFVYRID
jgi:hypothetical protein